MIRQPFLANTAPSTGASKANRSTKANLLILSVLSILLSAVILAPAQAAGAWSFKITKTGIGIRFRNSPNWIDSAGAGGYDGDAFNGECWDWGTAQGNYANRIWWQGTTRFGRGWIPDAYLSSPNKANQPIPGAPQCRTPATVSAPNPIVDPIVVPPPPPSTTYVENGVTMGVANNQPHPYGTCIAQDFNKGIGGYPWDWFIRASAPGGQTFTVRNGMLWGWFDNGGGEGALGCPLGDETTAKNNLFRIQKFTNGSLVWWPGRDHAIVYGPESAAQWAEAQNGQQQTPVEVRSEIRSGDAAVYWSGYCYAFAWTAWGGTDLKGNPLPKDYAVKVGKSLPLQKAGIPPRGAIVFYDFGDIAGHAALSVGNGNIATTQGNTQLGSPPAVTIKPYFINGYMGWYLPV
jgi:LGFP repeat